MTTQFFDQRRTSLVAARVLGMQAVALAVLIAAMLIARPIAAQAAEPTFKAMPAVWGETLASLEAQEIAEAGVVPAGFKVKKRFGGRHHFRGHRGFRGGFFRPHGFSRHGGFRRGLFFGPGFKGHGFKNHGFKGHGFKGHGFKNHGFKGHGFKGNGGFKKKGVFFG